MINLKNSDNSSNMSTNPPLSIVSSNFDNLECAKAKLSEAIINIDQFYPEIEGEIKVYAEKMSYLGDNSESLKDEDTRFHELEDNTEDRPEKEEKPEGAGLFSTQVGSPRERTEVGIGSRSTTFSDGAPNTMTSSGHFGLSGLQLPSLRQVLDTRAAEHYAAGMVALKTACFGQALSHFSHCISLRPAEPSYFANRAEVYFQLCDLQSAIANYKHACILNPDNRDFFQRLAFLYVFHAQTLFDLGRYSAALEAVCKAIEIFPENQNYQIRAIVVLAALGRPGDCMALVDRQIEAGGDTSSTGDLLVLRAKLHANMRQYSLAYYDLVDAVRATTHFPGGHPEAQSVLQSLRQRAALLHEAAVQQALQHRLYEATGKLSLAVELDPVCARLNVTRGALFRRQSHFSAAVDDFLMAMDKVDHNEQDPVYKESQKQLVLSFNDFAVQCFNKSYIEEAIVLLNKAIQADKSEPGFYMNRADCFFKLRQWDYAKADYEQAAYLSPEYRLMTVDRLARVAFAFGQLCFSQEHYEDAELSFSQAINCSPHIPGFWKMRARVRLVLQDFRNARIDLVCGICLSDLDRESESIFHRLFPGKTITQVLQSSLATSTCRSVLGTTLKAHLRSLDVLLPPADGASTATVPRPAPETTSQDPVKITSDTKLPPEMLLHQKRERYRQVVAALDCCLRNSSISNIATAAAPRPPLLPTIPADRRDICGVVGRADGSQFFLGDGGSLSRIKPISGWRQFGGLLESL